MPTEQAAAARFADRFLAFLIDLWLFAGAYFATLTAIVVATQRPATPGLRIGAALVFYALFCFYHAKLTAGRGTLGKRLLGIAVVDEGGNAPSFADGLRRSAAYLASSIFNLGFLWAYWQPEGRAWHDLLVGTRVVETREKGPWLRRGLTLGAWAAGAFLAASWFFVYIAGPRFFDMQLIADAREGLGQLAILQERHKEARGRYARDVRELAALTEDPQGFLEALATVVEPGAGVRLADRPGGGYSIEARARDRSKTPVKLER